MTFSKPGASVGDDMYLLVSRRRYNTIAETKYKTC
jgi:hypothetical protein